MYLNPENGSMIARGWRVIAEGWPSRIAKTGKRGRAIIYANTFHPTWGWPKYGVIFSGKNGRKIDKPELSYFIDVVGEYADKILNT